MKYPKRNQYKYAKEKKYRLRNWAAYNDARRRRGDLTIWFCEDAIGHWEADKTGKPGGQNKYSELATDRFAPTWGRLVSVGRDGAFLARGVR